MKDSDEFYLLDNLIWEDCNARYDLINNDFDNLKASKIHDPECRFYHHLDNGNIVTETISLDINEFIDPVTHQAPYFDVSIKNEIHPGGENLTDGVEYVDNVRDFYPRLKRKLIFKGSDQSSMDPTSEERPNECLDLNFDNGKFNFLDIIFGVEMKNFKKHSKSADNNLFPVVTDEKVKGILDVITSPENEFFIKFEIDALAIQNYHQEIADPYDHKYSCQIDIPSNLYDWREIYGYRNVTFGFKNKESFEQMMSDLNLAEADYDDFIQNMDLNSVWGLIYDVESYSFSGSFENVHKSDNSIKTFYLPEFVTDYRQAYNYISTHTDITLKLADGYKIDSASLGSCNVIEKSYVASGSYLKRGLDFSSYNPDDNTFIFSDSADKYSNGPHYRDNLHTLPGF